MRGVDGGHFCYNRGLCPGKLNDLPSNMLLRSEMMN